MRPLDQQTMPNPEQAEAIEQADARAFYAACQHLLPLELSAETLARHRQTERLRVLAGQVELIARTLRQGAPDDADPGCHRALPVALTPGMLFAAVTYFSLLTAWGLIKLFLI